MTKIQDSRDYIDNDNLLHEAGAGYKLHEDITEQIYNKAYRAFLQQKNGQSNTLSKIDSECYQKKKRVSLLSRWDTYNKSFAIAFLGIVCILLFGLFFSHTTKREGDMPLHTSVQGFVEQAQAAQELPDASQDDIIHIQRRITLYNILGPVLKEKRTDQPDTMTIQEDTRRDSIIYDSTAEIEHASILTKETVNGTVLSIKMQTSVANVEYSSLDEEYDGNFYGDNIDEVAMSQQRQNSTSEIMSLAISWYEGLLGTDGFTKKDAQREFFSYLKEYENVAYLGHSEIDGNKVHVVRTSFPTHFENQGIHKFSPYIDFYFTKYYEPLGYDMLFVTDKDDVPFRSERVDITYTHKSSSSDIFDVENPDSIVAQLIDRYNIKVMNISDPTLVLFERLLGSDIGGVNLSNDLYISGGKIDLTAYGSYHVPMGQLAFDRSLRLTTTDSPLLVKGVIAGYEDRENQDGMYVDYTFNTTIPAGTERTISYEDLRARESTDFDENQGRVMISDLEEFFIVFIKQPGKEEATDITVELLE